jgi:hypothetical protein
MPQQFKFVYNLQPLQLDVAAQSNTVTIVPSVRVFVGSIFQDPGTYTVATTTNSTTITFNTVHAVGDVIEVEVLSDQVSQVAFYQVPLNLNNNPLNANSPSFTLGTLRTHYNSICPNLPINHDTPYERSITKADTPIIKSLGFNNLFDIEDFLPIVPFGPFSPSSPL